MQTTTPIKLQSLSKSWSGTPRSSSASYLTPPPHISEDLLNKAIEERMSSMKESKKNKSVFTAGYLTPPIRSRVDNLIKKYSLSQETLRYTTSRIDRMRYSHDQDARYFTIMSTMRKILYPTDDEDRKKAVSKLEKSLELFNHTICLDSSNEST